VKIAVIAMGAVIVVGFIVVVVTIVQRLARPDRAAGEIGLIALPLQPGCWIADAWSAEGRLYLRIDGEGACRQVAIVDEALRKVVGLVVAVEAPPAAVPAPAPGPSPTPTP
jgi:hypothetical protein